MLLRPPHEVEKEVAVVPSQGAAHKTCGRYLLFSFHDLYRPFLSGEREREKEKK